MGDRFLDPLILEAILPKGWRVSRRFRYQTDIGKQRTIQIPVGFQTDLASIPRIFRSFVTKDGPSRYAAVVHDYLYSLKGKGPKGVPRQDADNIFREAMISVKVPRWKRVVMHRAVQGFGWILFNKEPKGLNIPSERESR